MFQAMCWPLDRCSLLTGHIGTGTVLEYGNGCEMNAGFFSFWLNLPKSSIAGVSLPVLP